MSWLSAKTVAEKWLARKFGKHRLEGRTVLIPDFLDDETCRKFYRDRDLGFHRMICRAIVRGIRVRGGTTVRCDILESEYQRDRGHRLDSFRARQAYIESAFRVL